LRREQLLSTALGLFATHGYAGTSTRRIAEAAGVTEGLLFHYFGTKEALLVDLMARQTSFAGRVLRLVQEAQGRSARDLFRAIAAGYAEVSADEAKLIAFASVESLVNPRLREPLAMGHAVMHERLLRLLEARVDAGELRPEASLDATILGFFGGFHFFFTQHQDHVGTARWRTEAAAFAEAWAEQCWRGLAREPRSDHSKSDSSSVAARRRRSP
jgi:AcrR family transcriptional regulator